MDSTRFSKDQTVQTPQTEASTASQWTQERTVVRDRSVTDTPGTPEQPAEPQDMQQRILKSRFVLEERVGSGGMGSVFRARDLRKVEARDSRPYLAVKVLNNDFKRHPEAFIALEREAAKSQGLRHRNIVTIFDFDKDGDVPFITMELLEGQELAALLQNYPSGMPSELALPLIRDIVLGLQHAHGEGVVHADLKPGNVFVTDQHEAKVLDFGIARAMRANGGGEDTDFDPAQLAALTPAYASREMLLGDNPEPRDDLYSLGVVIYMMLTGVHPYGRLSATDAAKEQLKPERIKVLPWRAWKTLEACLAFSRQDRPASIDELHDAFFGQTPWRTFAIAAGVAAMVLFTGLGVTTLSQQAELDTVKQEVRTETLVYAQVNRLGELLDVPEFNRDWHDAVFTEFQQLMTIAPQEGVTAALGQRINTTFMDGIRNSDSLIRGEQILLGARQFAAASVFADVWRDRLRKELLHLSEQRLDESWLYTAGQVFGLLEEHLPEAALDEERSIVLLDLAERINGFHAPTLQHSTLDVAGRAWNMFGTPEVTGELHGQIQERLDGLQRSLDQRASKTAKELQMRDFVAAREGVVKVDCERLDVSLIAHTLGEVAAHAPDYLPAMQQQASRRLGACIRALAASDPDRSQSMARQVQRELGVRYPDLAAVSDPTGGGR